MICGARGEQVRAGLTHEQPITDYTQISIIHIDCRTVFKPDNNSVQII